jgi:hypothetical protein
MNGEVPEIYWYLFWVAVLAWVIVFAVTMMTLVHRAHMRTLELLRLYAEKGVEPPPALYELLARASGGGDPKWSKNRRGTLLKNFTGMVFTACVAGGILWWRIDEGGPQALIYILGAATVFWGVSALGLLIAALFTSDK